MSDINIPKFCNSLYSEPDKEKKLYKVSEIKKLLETGKPLFEWLDVSKAFKPYFDVDKYIDVPINEDDLQKETDKYVGDSKKALQTLFKNSFKVDLNLDTDFAIESNSRLLKKKVKGTDYFGKVSLHIIIPKYKIQGSFLKQTLIDTKNSDVHDGLFDISIYNKGTQKFRVAGFRKMPNDPSKPVLLGSLPITDYLITRVDSTNILIKGEVTDIVKPVLKSKTNPQSPKTPKTPKDDKPVSVVCNNKEVQELFDIIGVVDCYDTWLKISIATKNYNPDLKDMWDKWCSKSANYDADKNSKMWDNFYKGETSLSTIKYYAKLINPDKYNMRLTKNELNNFIKDGTQLSASNLFCKLYGKYIKCIDQQKQIFMLYDHKKCIWTSKTIVSIYNEVSNVIQSELDKEISDITAKIDDAGETHEAVDKQDEWAVYLKKLRALKKDLSTAAYIGGVNKFLAGNPTIFDEDFRSKTTAKTDILSVRNGIIELRTGKLRPRTYDDYQLGYIDIDYNEKAEYSEWDAFLRDLFDHPNITKPEEMMAYIHKLFGYLITKETSAQVMTIANGSGGNGKSVVSNVMQMTFKGCVTKVDESILDKSQKSNANSASPEVAKLYNKTTAFIEEMEDTTELGKAFKQLVGGGESIARELYGNPFVFQNTAKLVMNTNVLPSFKSSHAFLRRIVIIQYWNQYVCEEERKEGDKLRDDKKEESLLENREGIMKWFVEGAMLFYKEGQLDKIPEEMRAAKKELQNANDWTSTLEFTGNPSDKMTNAELNEHIETQCAMKVNSKDMKKILEGKGAIACKVNGNRGYKGLLSTIMCKNEIIEMEEEHF